MKTLRTPHPTAAIFKQHLVTVAKIVNATGYSKSCISHVLTGIFSPSAALDAALRRYARQVPSFSIPTETILPQKTKIPPGKAGFMGVEEFSTTSGKRVIHE